MGVKKLQQNVFRFTSILLNTWFLAIGLLIFFAYMVSKDTGFSFLGMIIMLMLFYIFFIWFRAEKQGIVLDLDKRVIKLKPNYFTALFKPFGKLSQNVINLDEIISASLNFDVHVDKDNKPSISYGVNLTGTFGSKNLDFMTRETAQSLYAMIASACNFDTMY
jgi:hypothetical protein